MKPKGIFLLFLLCSIQAIGQLRYEPNKGQLPDQVLADVKLSGGRIFFQKSSILFNYFSVEDLERRYSHDHHDHHDQNSLINEENKLRAHAYEVALVGSNNYSIEYQNRSAWYSNYIFGSDPNQWASHVYAYEEILMKEVWDGISIRYSTQKDHPYYQIELAPNADPSDIQLEYQFADSVSLNKSGDLEISLSVNTITETGLSAYQIIRGKREIVPIRIQLEEGKVTYRFPEGYDNNYALIIDPQLVASSYTGSVSDNFGYTATPSVDGSIYAAGAVFGNNYPTTTGAYDTNFDGATDVGITKFNQDASALVYSTYLGGANTENANSIIENSKGELVIMGVTSSLNFPVSSSAISSQFNGGTSRNIANNGANYTNGTDLFFTVLSADGSELVGSTYLGGSRNDGLNDDITNPGSNPLYYNYNDVFRGEVIVDQNDNIVFTSTTFSSNFPVTIGQFKGQLDAVYGKLNPNLSSLEWSSYYGTNKIDAGYSIKQRGTGGFFMVGGTNGNNLPETIGTLNPSYLGGEADGYLTQITPTGNILSSTYLGQNQFDQAYFVDVDTDNNPYVFGLTTGSDFPHSNGAIRQGNSGQFLIKLDPNLQRNLLSTTYGKGDESPDISPTAFLVDDCGNVYFAGFGGQTNNIINQNNENTEDLPISPDAQFPETDGNDFHFYVLEKDATDILYATYFGGTNSSDHVDGGTSRFDSKGIAYHAVCGSCGTTRGDIPTTPNAYSSSDMSTNCNLAVFKFEFDLLLQALSTVSPGSVGCVPFSVDFVNNSSPGATFSWDLGDGSSSTAFEPSHTYNEVGTYQVKLFASDDSKCNPKDTASLEIVVRDTFSLMPPTISAKRECDSIIITANFDAPEETDIRWFVNNTLYTEASFSTIISTQEDIIISLEAGRQDPCVKNISFDTILSYDLIESQLDIIENITRTCEKLTVELISNTEVTNLAQYEWIINGQTVDTDSVLAFVSTQSEVFDIQFVLNDPNLCGVSDTTKFSIEYNQTPLELEIDITEEFSCQENTLFGSAMSNSSSQIQWDFGNGNQSTDNSVVEIYDEVGTYIVNIITTDSSFCNISDTVEYSIAFDSVQIRPEFDISILDSCNSFQFTANYIGQELTNQAAILWEFPDGSTSSDISIEQNFSDTGTFEILLTVEDSTFCNIGFDTSYIVKFEGFNLSSAIDITSQVTCEKYQITAQSGNSDVKVVNWDFGDGNTSTDDPAIHEYASTGTYIITATVQSLECPNISEPLNQEITISDIPLDVDINFQNQLDCDDLSVTFQADTIQQSWIFAWDFGDGIQDTGSPIQHQYPTAGTYEVQLILTDQFNCTGADTANKTILIRDNELVPIIGTNQLASCDPIQVMFFNETQVPIDSFIWKFSNGFESNSDSVLLEFNKLEELTASLIIFDSLNCNKQDSLTIPVLFDSTELNVTVDIDPELSCDKYLVNFFPQPQDGLNYEWEFSDGTFSNEQNESHVFPGPGQYAVQLIVSAEGYCNEKDTLLFPLELFDDPIIADFDFTIDYTCDSAIAMFENKSDQAFSYFWNFGNGLSTDEENPIIIYRNQGDYQVQLIAIDSFNCNRTDTIEQTISYRITSPEFTSSIDPVYDCSSFKADCIVDSEEEITFRWEFSDGNINAQQAFVKTFPDFGTYAYSLFVSDSTGCDTTLVTDSIRLFQTNTPLPYILDYELSCPDFIVNFSAQDFPNAEFLWLLDSDSLIGRNVSYNFPSAGEWPIELFRIDSSYCNPIDSISDVLKFSDEPLFVDFIFEEENFCDSLQIEILNLSDTVDSYFWNFGDGNTSVDRNPTHTYSSGGTQVISLTISDSTNCNEPASLEKQFFYNNVPIIADFTVQPEVKSCEEFFVEFTLETQAVNSVQWDFGDGTFSSELDPNHSYFDTGVFEVKLVVFDSLSCNSSDTFILDLEFQADPLDYTYSAEPIGECDSFIIHLEANSSSSTSEFYWDMGDGSTGFFSSDTLFEYAEIGLFPAQLIVLDSFNCLLADTVNFESGYLNDSVIASFDLITDLNCDSLKVDAINTSYNGRNFLWDFGDGTIVSGDSVSHSYSEYGIYTITLVVEDTFICNSIDTIIREVNFPPPVSVNITYEEIVCEKDPVLFTSQGKNILTYFWDFDDGQTSIEQNPEHLFDLGSYRVTLIAVQPESCNQADTAYADIDLEVASVVADFTYEPKAPILVMTEVQFENLSYGANEYFWEFSDGGFSEEAEPERRFRSSDTINMCLQAIGEGSCIDTMCKTLFVEPFGNIDVPNAFTPDGDNVNDILYVRAYGAVEVDFKLFNRWGELVFETTDLSIGWDGTVNGKAQPMEVYMYVLRGMLNNGTLINKKGNVSLIR